MSRDRVKSPASPPLKVERTRIDEEARHIVEITERIQCFNYEYVMEASVFAAGDLYDVPLLFVDAGFRSPSWPGWLEDFFTLSRLIRCIQAWTWSVIMPRTHTHAHIASLTSPSHLYSILYHTFPSRCVVLFGCVCVCVCMCLYMAVLVCAEYVSALTLIQSRDIDRTKSWRVKEANFYFSSSRQ